MDAFASHLIDVLGGTTEVARMADAPTSTIQNMRRKLTPSRLNHLRRIAHMDKPSVDVGALALAHGVQLAPLTGGPTGVVGDERNSQHAVGDNVDHRVSASGNLGQLSGEVIA